MEDLKSAAVISGESRRVESSRSSRETEIANRGPRSDWIDGNERRRPGIFCAWVFFCR